MSEHSLLANAVRFLAVDAVEKAQSGHPGVALGFADVLCVLWRKHLQLSADNVHVACRHRFVLSNGHASALYYALIHMAGLPLTIDDLKSFRQWGSSTPGHPERDLALGIDVTTGPLGQGLANAVGMAASLQYKALSQPAYHDKKVYVSVGDGCLMEGVSHEACSLAGDLGLANLIVLWDDNGISIDGSVVPWFSEDVTQRFVAYQWHVIEDVDGHDPVAIDKALLQAVSVTDKPVLIAFKTHIGYGSAWQDQAKSHGQPLGKEQIALLKSKCGWPDKAFYVPKEAYAAWSRYMKPLQDEVKTPSRAFAWEGLYKCVLAEDGMLSEASRVSSKHCLAYLVEHFPSIIGGSADLSSSTGVWHDKNIVWKKHAPGNFIHFGVREFAMCAMANGMAAMGLRPYVSTFLVFSDYATNAIRMAALMQLPVSFVLTHDSVALGEDGPTHQPVEHLAHLRATPNVDVWRPCDRFETAVAWEASLTRAEGPSCLVLSRQALTQYGKRDRSMVLNGGYRLVDQAHATVAILATGSEVDVAVLACEQLAAMSIVAVVISLPCMEAFLRQPKAYQQEVLPDDIVCRVAIEAGSPHAWFAMGIAKDMIVGIDHYGASAPGSVMLNQKGICAESIVEKVRCYKKQHLAKQVVTEVE